MTAITPSAVSGWYRDPTGRFDERLFDGTVWTDFVRTGGGPAIDHLTNELAGGLLPPSEHAVVRRAPQTPPAPTRSKWKRNLFATLAALFALAAIFAATGVIRGWSTSQSKPPQTLQQWYDATHQQDKAQALLKSLQEASDANAAKDRLGVRAACRQIARNSQVIARTLPSPDAEFNTAMRSATNDMISGAGHCIQGLDTGNANEVEMSRSAFAAADAEFARAATIVQQSQQQPPTRAAPQSSAHRTKSLQRMASSSSRRSARSL